MTRALAISLSLVAALACMHGYRGSTSSGVSEAGATSGGSTSQADMSGMCPMDVPGARVTAEDTTTGEALTFTTSPDDAAALRERVHAMAEMHNRRHAAGDAGHHGMHGTMGGVAGTGMTMPPPSQASVEDLPEGARLVVTPKDPADLQRLQEAVRQHAMHMQQHGCAMMHGAGHGS